MIMRRLVEWLARQKFKEADRLCKRADDLMVRAVVLRVQANELLSSKRTLDQ